MHCIHCPIVYRRESKLVIRAHPVIIHACKYVRTPSVSNTCKPYVMKWYVIVRLYTTYTLVSMPPVLFFSLGSL